MKHIKVEIRAKECQQEELIAMLDDCYATGFEQTDEMLAAWFEEGFAKDAVLNFLKDHSYQLTEIDERNWNEEWERNFQPVRVDDFVAVRAHFHSSVENVDHEIIITPKMSFGTGHHATTYLMMRQMRSIRFNGKTVFDFGTGTGILSILAEKLGAKKITAIDVDDWSIRNAKENFAQNDCSTIDVSLSSTIPQQPFEVILANINRNVILDYMPQLAGALLYGAVILFSGLLVADEDAVKPMAQNFGLYLQHRQERDGWLSLLFAKQG